MAIEGIDLDDLDRNSSFGITLPLTTHVDTLPQEEADLIRRIEEIEISAQELNSPNSLEGRVTLPIEEVFNRIDPQELEEIFNADPSLGSNYITKLQELVAKILAQYQQISEKDKLKIEQLEKEYKLTTLSVANIQRELGWSGLKFAAVTFAATALSQFIPNDVDRAVGQSFAKDICPKLGDLWNAELNAKFTSGQALNSMLLNKYNLLSGAEQNKANEKQQVSGVFEKALRNQESATRNG